MFRVQFSKKQKFLPGLEPHTLYSAITTAVVTTLLIIKNLKEIKKQKHNYKGKTLFFRGERN
jgi:hypothetical protein